MSRKHHADYYTICRYDACERSDCKYFHRGQVHGQYAIDWDGDKYIAIHCGHPDSCRDKYCNKSHDDPDNIAIFCEDGNCVNKFCKNSHFIPDRSQRQGFEYERVPTFADLYDVVNTYKKRKIPDAEARDLGTVKRIILDASEYIPNNNRYDNIVSSIFELIAKVDDHF